MQDFVIAVFLAVILFFSFRSTLKHFRGESSCCGGCTYKARRKKLHTVAVRKVFAVEGMSCQHCINRVMEAVNSIDGASAAVSLRNGTVTVSMEYPIDDNIIKNAIEKAGYTVITE